MILPASKIVVCILKNRIIKKEKMLLGLQKGKGDGIFLQRRIQEKKITYLYFIAYTKTLIGDQ